MKVKFVDTLAGRWMLGVLITITVSFFGLVSSGFISLKNDAELGRKAYEQNEKDHLRYDSFTREQCNFLDRATLRFERMVYKDSVRFAEMYEQTKRDRIEQK